MSLTAEDLLRVQQIAHDATESRLEPAVAILARVEAGIADLTVASRVDADARVRLQVMMENLKDAVTKSADTITSLEQRVGSLEQRGAGLTEKTAIIGTIVLGAVGVLVASALVGSA